MESKLDLDAVIKDVVRVVGEDWNAGRARAYIAARISVGQQSIEKLKHDLYLETEVNKRVREVLGIK